MAQEFENEVVIPVGAVALEGDLTIPTVSSSSPSELKGIVVFAHGSGSSRLSSRNLQTAHYFHEAGFATLLLDLLTREEEMIDSFTRHIRFDIPLLAERLVAAVQWVQQVDRLQGLKLGFFGSSTGAGAALIAAANMGEAVSAVVSRSGRPDLASRWLPQVQSPTLLIVGELDFTIADLNRAAMDEMRCLLKLVTISGATHLFDEPGALELAAREATEWFQKTFARAAASEVHVASP